MRQAFAVLLALALAAPPAGPARAAEGESAADNPAPVRRKRIRPLAEPPPRKKKAPPQPVEDVTAETPAAAPAPAPPAEPDPAPPPPPPAPAAAPAEAP